MLYINELEAAVQKVFINPLLPYIQYQSHVDNDMTLAK